MAEEPFFLWDGDKKLKAPGDLEIQSLSDPYPPFGDKMEGEIKAERE